jgi:hypothetical protein
MKAQKTNKIYRIDYSNADSEFSTTLEAARAQLVGYKKISDLNESENEAEKYVLCNHPIFADSEARIVTVMAY